nr:RNA-directed DNA polymerase [Tanacetum cinerariifolium]
MVQDIDKLMYADQEEALVTQLVLNVAVAETGDDTSWLRNNIFRSKCTTKGKLCTVIIDWGSCDNMVATSMVEKLGLVVQDHPEPYQLTWLKKGVSSRSTNRTMGRSPFFIVCGREPLTPLDLAPIPITERISSEGEVRSAHIKELHAQVRETILKHTGKYQARANKHHKQARADGPFWVLKRINDNTYKIELTRHYNMSAAFNVADLSPYEGDSDDGLQSRVPLFQDGEDDAGASHASNLFVK